MQRSQSKTRRIFLRFSRYGLLFIVCGLLLVILSAGTVFFSGKRLTNNSVVIMGNPVILMTVNAKDRSVIFLTIPSDVMIDSVHGYGPYPLESLWKLGSIDQKEDALASLSLQEQLGLPVNLYIGEKGELKQFIGTPLERARAIFSFGNIGSILMHRYRTDLSIFPFLYFTRSLLSLSPEKVTVIDAKSNTIIQNELRPDGKYDSKFMINRFDEIIGHAYDNEEVVQERLSIAIYNSTSVPALGNKMGMFLSHLGMLVVTVGNTSPEVDVCTITGTGKTLKSMTARMINTYYHCTAEANEEAERADIILTIGREFAKRFLPQAKH